MTAAHRGDRVILLHGLARTRHSMAPLARAFAADDFAVRNVGYPSTRHEPGVLASLAMERGLTGWQPGQHGRVHVVTHSLGGLLLRLYLEHHALPSLGRVVMLAPPNHGSEIVDALGHLGLFRWFNGPSGADLGTGPDALPARLGPVTFPLGVIAGRRCRDPVLGRHLPGPSDGKVTVASTRVAGMTDHVTVDATHTFIMRNREAIRQSRHFLAHGRFDPGKR